MNFDHEFSINSDSPILFLVPHLSTGGMPQYVYWIVDELVKKLKKVYVVEYSDIAPIYVVQKNRIKDIIGRNLITLSGNDDKKRKDLMEIIKNISPSVVHLQEVPEMWLPKDTSEVLYDKNRSYRIVETSHDAGFNPFDKKFLPDSFAFISKYHPSIYSCFNIPYEIVEYPVIYQERPDRDESLMSMGLDPSFKHILNVGLFTPRKNQEEIFKIADAMRDEKVVFHFVGNHADNFRNYWEPLMRNKPSNCRVWGEREDVDKFYSCMDLFLFTSKGTEKDRETNPLVLKEAIGWKMPILMYNLPVYCGMYDGYNSVNFLKGDLKEDINSLKNIINKDELLEMPFISKNFDLEDGDSVLITEDLKVYINSSLGEKYLVQYWSKEFDGYSLLYYSSLLEDGEFSTVVDKRPFMIKVLSGDEKKEYVSFVCPNKEFGEELFFYILKIRRKIDIDNTWNEFKNFLIKNKYLLSYYFNHPHHSEINLRWLVSIVDSFVDCGSPIEISNGMLLSLLANNEKILGSLDICKEDVFSLKKESQSIFGGEMQSVDWDEEYSDNHMENIYERMDRALRQTPILHFIYKLMISKIKNTPYTHFNLSREFSTYEKNIPLSLKERFVSEDKKYSDMYSSKNYNTGPVDDLFNFASQFISFKDKKVIDCGCGHGTLIEKVNPKKYIGIDVCSYQLDKLSNQNTDSNYIHCVLQDIPLGSKVSDISFCCDVLEHIFPDDIDDVIREVTRVSHISVFNISLRESFFDGDRHGEDKLHQIVKGIDWWREKLSLFGEITHEEERGTDYFCILSTEFDIPFKSKKEDDLEIEAWIDDIGGENHNAKVTFVSNKDMGEDLYFCCMRDLNTGLHIYNDYFKIVKGSKYWIEAQALRSHLSGIIFEIINSKGEVVFRKDCDYGNDINFKVKGNLVYPKTYNMDGWFAFYEVFVIESYYDEKMGIKVEEGDICLDCGGNYGFFSLYAVDKGASKVVSVEPLSTTFDCLKENVKKFKEVMPLNVAVGRKTEEVIMHVSPYSGGNSIQKVFYERCLKNRPEAHKLTEEKVKVVNINEVIEKCELDRIDFLKVDIEGSEYDMFEALDEAYLSNSVGKIIMEFHMNFDNQINEVVSKLKRCGFTYRTTDTTKAEGFLWAKKKDIDSFKPIDSIKIPNVDVSISSDSKMIEAIKDEIFVRKIYEKHFKVEKKDVVVDLGSHVGCFSLSCINKGISKCFCLEPSFKNFSFLKDNIEKMANSENFILINKAIGDVSGVELFKEDSAMGGVGFKFPNDSEGDTECEVISFMDFVNSNNIESIDFLKIDCEGGEYSVFNREENFNYISNNVRKIAGELHIRGDEKEKKMSIDMINNLISMGFDVIVESVDGFDITNRFKTHFDKYTEVLFYAQKRRY